MSFSLFRKTILATVISASCLSNLIQAEEGGTGHYATGGLSTIVDLPPTIPGWIFQPLYINYQGDSSTPLPAYGKNTFDIEAKVDALALGGVYTFEEKFLGAFYSIGLYVPYVNMDITATIRDPGTGTESHEVASGLGDMTFIPLVMSWKDENWQYSFALPVYAPTGDYDKDNLANQGVNYWTVDPTLILAYTNPDNGFNMVASSGLTFNSENNDTDYKSGSVWHTEASIQQLLPLGPGFISVGVNAFLYEQIEGDSGDGAVLGDFKGSSYGLGPVLGYVLPTEDSGTGVIEIRWLPEYSTEKRLKGDFIWIKGGWQF